MTIVSIICFTLFAVLVLTGLQKNSDFFSPARIFVLVWALSICLADLKLSGYQHVWSDYSWFILMVSLLSFLLGNYISYTMNLKNKLLTVSSIRNVLELNNKEGARLYFSIIILFIIYFICFLTEILIEGYIPLFSMNIAFARVNYGVFGIHLFVNSQVVIMYFCAMYFILIRNERKKKIIVNIIFLLTAISFFLLLQRFNYFVWGILILCTTYYSTKLFRPTRILIIGILFFIILYLIQAIRLSQYLQSYIYIISKMKYSHQYAFLTEPYMYIVMNLENFGRAVDKLDYNTYGLLSFDWIIALTGIKSTIHEYFQIIERPFLVSGYNTYPFMWYYYSDFGIAGIFVLPLVLAFLISEIYYRMRQKPTLLILMLYSFCLVFIIVSFFTNIFTMINFIFYILISSITLTYVQKDN